MNLNNNEQEIPEVQLEEYALKLNASDSAWLKGQSKATKKRTCLLFTKNSSIGKRTWTDVEPENILSPIVTHRRK